MRAIPEPREILNVRQAAEYLGISADTVYDHAGKGKIPGWKIGKLWRFRRSVLHRWLMDAQRNPNKPKETL